MPQYTDQLTASQLIWSIAHGHYELSVDKVKCERNSHVEECRDWLAAHPTSGMNEEVREVVEWIASQSVADTSDRLIREQRDLIRQRCSDWLDANPPPSSDGALDDRVEVAQALFDALAKSDADVAVGRTRPADEVIARLRKKGDGQS